MRWHCPLAAFIAALVASDATKSRASFVSSNVGVDHGGTIFLARQLQTASSSSQSRLSSLSSLQQQILNGATEKLRQQARDSQSSPVAVKQLESKDTDPNNAARGTWEEEQARARNCSFFVRHADRNEMDQIVDALMISFHPDSNPSFDSYIRRYKANHLKMCFDAIDESERGLFVAVSRDPSKQNDERIVGFCSVDGRAPDPDCRVENLTPSTLARTPPRPYLSDLGVSLVHRRRGIGVELVRACEEWTRERGYAKLYLKVEKRNTSGCRLYSEMGYTKTSLPWPSELNDSRWETPVLMERSLYVDGDDRRKRAKRKRTWLKNNVWVPAKSGVRRVYSSKGKAPPL